MMQRKYPREDSLYTANAVRFGYKQPQLTPRLPKNWPERSASIHLRPEENDLGGAALELPPPNPELAKAEAE